MNEDLTDKTAMIMGVFTISCLAGTQFYGWHAFITWLLGLFLFAALLKLVFGNRPLQ